MSEQPTGAERSFITRLRERRLERRAIRADRRARRKGHMGASPDDAARQSLAAALRRPRWFSSGANP